MYDYIIGKLVNKNSISKDKTITVECNNIGYLINFNERNLQIIGDIGSDVKIYLSLIHKEDSMTLCGFLTKEERDIFKILQSVSGVGVKVALVLLNEFNSAELISAVIKEDSKQISRAKGVGSKMAQKIVIELKDKLLNWQNTAQLDLSEIKSSNINEDTINEVTSVLASLGYTPKEIADGINHCSLKISTNNSEELLKETLQYLSIN